MMKNLAAQKYQKKSFQFNSNSLLFPTPILKPLIVLSFVRLAQCCDIYDCILFKENIRGVVNQ